MKSTAVWALLLLLLTGCGEKAEVELRQLPYPYRAGLAICSDIDETGSIEEFMAIQTFLCTNEETDLGDGLGLEIGNTFWFYNDYLDSTALLTGVAYSGNPDSGLALFADLSGRLADHAGLLLALIRAGYLDANHAYGHFGSGQFSRALAQRADSLALDDPFSTDVFINHGAHANKQNVGDAWWFEGDNSGSDYYHTDLSLFASTKFLWHGQLTHCLGQDGSFSWSNLLKQKIEWWQDWRDDENNFAHDNRLLHEIRLDDGTVVFDFVRYINPWGEHAVASEEYLSLQLGPDQVDELIDNGGFCVFYTHLGKNNGPPYISEPTVAALRYIEAAHRRGDLMVTTTSRLLNYVAHHQSLYWHTETDESELVISLDSIVNNVEGVLIPTASDVAGITFYIPDDRSVALQAGGLRLPQVENQPDESGRRSVSVAWAGLEWPALGLADSAK